MKSLKQKQIKFKLIALLLLALASFLISLKLGKISVSWDQIINFLTGHPVDSEIFLTLKVIRFSRGLAAFFVGALLAVSGCILQALLRNPLADTYTLGISGGGAVGASIALYLALIPAYIWLPAFSVIGAFLAVTLVLIFSMGKLKSESRSLILTGVMLSLLLGAVSIFIVSLLPIEKSQWALSWLMGEFGSPRDEWVIYFSPFCTVALAFTFLNARKLDILALGDIKAMSLGVSAKKEKTIFIFIATLFAAMAISISGLIGFIGLVSPHLARRFLKTSNHQNILAASFLIGGTLLLLADSIGRSIAAQRDIPAGSLAALIGAPILIYMLLEKKNAQSE